MIYFYNDYFTNLKQYNFLTVIKLTEDIWLCFLISRYIISKNKRNFIFTTIFIITLRFHIALHIITLH